jgi:hypothetical protein
MKGSCPCGRRCDSCVYSELCGGCLENGCIHVRESESRVKRDSEKCLFCMSKEIEDSCPTTNPPPPKEFNCLGPWTLKESIKEWSIYHDEFTEQPTEPHWPLLIPEASDISDTTSRLGVWPDEGNWDFERWDPVAWDMTGYLFDKVQSAPWVRDPDTHQEEDWHYILGPHENWIQDILLVDRLPDRLAMQTPPSSVMAAYLNRLYAYQWKLILDSDAPRPWIVTHGYPSYVDWPPAWHWNLGIRMLSSLAAYIGSQAFDIMGAPEDVWYPDKSRKTSQHIRVPFVQTETGPRLLFRPDSVSLGPTEMDWDRFPGIIPFVPGADTNQIAWFTQHIVSMGYTTVALDAMNTLAHENFVALPEAIRAAKRGGARHVMVYGPWPLHIPSKYVLTSGVSYVPSALHMDMTDRPKRFWRKKVNEEEQSKWSKLPNYRWTTLGDVAQRADIEICQCDACKNAVLGESDSKSIWKWGHYLRAGSEWQRKQGKKRKSEPDGNRENIRLRFQGPSYVVFRKCLHYPPEVQWESIEDIIETIVFNETKMRVQFPDGTAARAEDIRWTWVEEGHVWAWEFPHLED